jgi:hypothetical protein
LVMISVRVEEETKKAEWALQDAIEVVGDVVGGGCDPDGFVGDRERGGEGDEVFI